VRPSVGGKGVPRDEGEIERALAALLEPVETICKILLPLIEGEECTLNKKVFATTMLKLISTGEGTAVTYTAPLLFLAQLDKIRAPSWWTEVKNLPQTSQEIQKFLADFATTSGAAEYATRNIVSWRKTFIDPSFNQLKYPFHLWLVRCLKSGKVPAHEVVEAFEKMSRPRKPAASANRKPAKRAATSKPMSEDEGDVQPESDPDDSADKEDSDDDFYDDDEPEEVPQPTKKRKHSLLESSESEDDDGEPVQKSARTSLSGRLDKIRRSLKVLSAEVEDMELVSSDQAAQATAKLEETIAEQEKAITELGEANIQLELNNATLTTSAAQRDARIAELEALAAELKAANVGLTERLKASFAAFATLGAGL
jgi:coenzyme F420-reducing hydrogenase delta subunit